MNKIISFIFVACLTTCSASILALTAEECGLTYDDQMMLAHKDGDCVFMTPQVAQEITKVCKKFGLWKTINPAMECIIDAAKKGNRVVSADMMHQVMKEICRYDKNNIVFKEYRKSLDSGDASITLAPKNRNNNEKTRVLTPCPTSAVCPTGPPTCASNSKQTVFCNLGVNCFQACNALIENLWVSGCFKFPDCGEVIFTAQEFGAMFEDSCTSLIPTETGVAFPTPPYRLGAAFDVFTDGINDTGSCQGQLVVRTMPKVADVARPAPYVCFCVPGDFDAASDNSVEIDICFVVPQTPAAGDSVEFVLCYEFRDSTELDFIHSDGTNQTTTDTNTVTVAVPTGTATFNHYTATACIPASSVAALDIARIAFERTTPDGTEFDASVYATSITFRYPRTQCELPISGGNCP